MSETSNVGCLVYLVLGAFYVVCAILSWRWIEPECFWGFILFMFTWGVLLQVGRFVAGLLISVLEPLFKD